MSAYNDDILRGKGLRPWVVIDGNAIPIGNPAIESVDVEYFIREIVALLRVAVSSRVSVKGQAYLQLMRKYHHGPTRGQSIRTKK